MPLRRPPKGATPEQHRKYASQATPKGATPSHCPISTALSLGPRVNLDGTINGASSPAGKKIPFESQTSFHCMPFGRTGRVKSCSSQWALIII